MGGIVIQLVELMKQSLTLPVIASAFLSVLTVEFRHSAPETTWFRAHLKWENNLPWFLDIALTYVLAFLAACLTLALIFLAYLIFNILIGLL